MPAPRRRRGLWWSKYLNLDGAAALALNSPTELSELALELLLILSDGLLELPLDVWRKG